MKWKRNIAIGAIALSLTGAGLTRAQDQGLAAPQAEVNQSRWPLQAAMPDGSQVTIFQPQLDDYNGDQITARAAVGVTPQGQQEPVFGAVWLQTRVTTDRVARTVRVLDVNITRTVLPDSNQASQQALANTVRQALLARPVTLSLDQLLAMVETVQKEKSEAANLQTVVPTIVFKDHPTIKIQYDGTPRMSQTDGGLMRVINTPFFVALDPGSKSYFLKGAGRWFSAPDPMGPFQSAGQIPQAVEALAANSGYKDPTQPLTDAQFAGLEIMTATQPTELVWTNGQPELATISNTDLLFATNTDSDLFLQIETQQVYVLLSGRWYTAPSRNGPWTSVSPDKLPDDFHRIPPNSEKADVLAHVPGTQQAQDAIADTFVPQTAAVDRSKFDQPTVQYDGVPNFAPIEGTSLTYAVNTPAAVVAVGGSYYCCYNGVWYLSSTANGSWSVCTQVPADIYTIPPSCPLYPVRYCYVYGYNNDVVYVGYTPGYVGCYVQNGIVVYGTGYHYSPWEGRLYVPRPATFGFAAHYNPYYGQWGFGFALASGSGSLWIGQGADYWGRGGAWFGFGGYRPTYLSRDGRVEFPRGANATDIEQARRAMYMRDVYDRRNDRREVAAPQRAYVEPPRPTAGTPRNDIFADRDGHVYRKTVDGWEVRDNNQWRPAAPDVRTPPANPGRDVRPAEPNRVEPPRVDVPRGGTGRDIQPAKPPRVDTARGNPGRDVRPAEPPRAEPPKAEPAPANPGRNGFNFSDLNRDYKARVTGDQREHNYQPQGQPAPQARPTPPAPQGRQGGPGQSQQGGGGRADQPQPPAGRGR